MNIENSTLQIYTGNNIKKKFLGILPYTTYEIISYPRSDAIKVFEQSVMKYPYPMTFVHPDISNFDTQFHQGLGYIQWDETSHQESDKKLMAALSDTLHSSTISSPCAYIPGEFWGQRKVTFPGGEWYASLDKIIENTQILSKREVLKLITHDIYQYIGLEDGVLGLATERNAFFAIDCV